ncbi:MAG: amino acid permease, partial [Patescibacteria group bacterium]
MKQQHKSANGEIHLARTLGIPEVALLGVGALLGGGIFTLLGTAAGFAGGGLVFAMLLGSGIAFINLNAYIALATTFPGAGGGYQWVRAGLGDINGFLSGWCSWMASAVACALYAVSFGFFLEEFLFGYIRLSHGALGVEMWKIIFTASVILIFGFINYRGVKLSGKVGGIITVTILAILGAFIAFGAKEIVFAPELF